MIITLISPSSESPGWGSSLQPFLLHTRGCPGHDDSWFYSLSQGMKAKNTWETFQHHPCCRHHTSRTPPVPQNPSTAMPRSLCQQPGQMPSSSGSPRRKARSSWQLCLLLSAWPSRYLLVTFVLGQLSG